MASVLQSLTVILATLPSTNISKPIRFPQNSVSGDAMISSISFYVSLPSMNMENRKERRQTKGRQEQGLMQRQRGDKDKD